MNSDRLASIFEIAATDLRKLAAEGEADILTDIASSADEAQAQDKESLKMTFGFQIVLDMGADKQTSTLSWSVKRKLSTDHAIANPDQGELGFGD
jgi:hypothetical protein